MVKVTHLISAFVIGWSAIAVPAQQSAPTTGGLSTASTEALHNGKLSFWVSSRSPLEPFWSGLVNELKNDYPNLQVEWRKFQPDAFLPALGDALHNGKAPDVVFADNYAQEGPLAQLQMGRSMAGRPRHNENGLWMILNGAPDRKVAEAFFVWLEQPKDWRPAQPATHLLTAADQAKIRTIATETIEAFGALPVKLPQDALDPAIASFDWKLVRQQAPEDEKQSYSPVAEQVGGNSRLAFVALSALEQSKDSFGVLHSFLVLRKDNPTWKVFFLEPSISLPSTEQMIAKLDGIGLSNDSRQAAASITLLTPADGDHTTRVPAPEIAFEQKGDIGELTGIESQYFDPGQVEWSPSAIHWVETNADSTGVTRSPAPFGVGMQPHRWRVWSVNRAGEVTLSEWRTINFTN